MGLRFCFEEEWKLSEVDMGEIDGLRQIGCDGGYGGCDAVVGGLMKEIDGVRQIGGLRKEMSDAMGKVEDWESQSIVKGNGKGRCNAVVGGLMKEIDGLKKVDDRWSMVGKGMGKSILKSILKGNGEFLFIF